MERKNTTLYVVLLAMMMALCCVLTVFVQIPMGNGYVNFGDAVIFLAGSLLGPIAGAIVGGVGSALADLFSGYVIYAGFTLVVKAAEGFVCGWAYSRLFRNQKWVVRRILSMALGAACVIVGYFFTDWILYGIAAGCLSLLSSLIQVSVSMVIAFVVLPRLPELFNDAPKGKVVRDVEEVPHDEKHYETSGETAEEPSETVAAVEPEKNDVHSGEDKE